MAISAGCSGGIEPHFALEWERKLGDGSKFTERVPVYDRLPKGFTPKTSAEIDWRWHLKHQAAFQKHTDLAVSKTINMSNSARVEDIYDAYVYAWKLGLKGTTVYRDGCRETQVLNYTNRVPTPAVRSMLSNNGSDSTNSPDAADMEEDTGFLPKEAMENPLTDSQSDNTEICPECKGMVIRGEGCKTCVSCGYSACTI